MTLGEKVRERRKALGLTQSALAGERITRNMLSRIECDAADPSLATLRYLSDSLRVPLAYLFSDDDSVESYEKKEKMPAIREAYAEGKYDKVVARAEKLPPDDEITMLLAFSYFHIGKACTANGNLSKAKHALEAALDYAKKTVYDTDAVTLQVPLYLSVAKNIQTPLLEFDAEEYERAFSSTGDYEFYKYLTMDADYPFRNPVFRLHLQAKQEIRAHRYPSALPLLCQAEEYKSTGYYHAYAMLGLYADMELCYKQQCDFEKAYRYANKRLSMLEDFRA